MSADLLQKAMKKVLEGIQKMFKRKKKKAGNPENQANTGFFAFS